MRSRTARACRAGERWAVGGGPYGADGDAEQPRHVGLRQVLEAAQHQHGLLADGEPGQGRARDKAEFDGGRAVSRPEGSPGFP
jgi:hypothetical protein